MSLIAQYQQACSQWDAVEEKIKEAFVAVGFQYMREYTSFYVDHESRLRLNGWDGKKKFTAQDVAIIRRLGIEGEVVVTMSDTYKTGTLFRILADNTITKAWPKERIRVRQSTTTVRQPGGNASARVPDPLPADAPRDAPVADKPPGWSPAPRRNVETRGALPPPGRTG